MEVSTIKDELAENDSLGTREARGLLLEFRAAAAGLNTPAAARVGPTGSESFPAPSALARAFRFALAATA